MIRLIDLLKDIYEPGDVWKLKRGKKRWVGKNAAKKRRYFKNAESARQFAIGKSKGGKAGVPKPKKRAEKMEPIQTYSYDG